MPDARATPTVEVLPERDGTFSVCVMDDGGEVLEARVAADIVEAIGIAKIWAGQRRTTYRVVGAPPNPASN